MGEHCCLVIFSFSFLACVSRRLFYLSFQPSFFGKRALSEAYRAGGCACYCELSLCCLQLCALLLSLDLCRRVSSMASSEIPALQFLRQRIELGAQHGLPGWVKGVYFSSRITAKSGLRALS